MSYFSLTLVLRLTTSKIINDVAKVQIKSEKITAFGGIFFVLDKFDSILSSVIDKKSWSFGHGHLVIFDFGNAVIAHYI